MGKPGGKREKLDDRFGKTSFMSFYLELLLIFRGCSPKRIKKIALFYMFLHQESRRVVDLLYFTKMNVMPGYCFIKFFSM